MSYGATYEEALDMDIRGCYETGVRANEVSPTIGYVNEQRQWNTYSQTALKQG